MVTRMLATGFVSCLILKNFVWSCLSVCLPWWPIGRQTLCGQVIQLLAGSENLVSDSFFMLRKLTEISHCHPHLWSLTWLVAPPILLAGRGPMLCMANTSAYISVSHIDKFPHYLKSPAYIIHNFAQMHSFTECICFVLSNYSNNTGFDVRFYFHAIYMMCIIRLSDMVTNI